MALAAAVSATTRDDAAELHHLSVLPRLSLVCPVAEVVDPRPVPLSFSEIFLALGVYYSLYNSHSSSTLHIMSSMRNAVQRRNHKERAQPLERAKHGLLEKHKDYSLRAADFNAKKARLRLLRQKATDRNPDEFHFGMMSSSTRSGVKISDRGNKSMSDDVVKLLKTQDAGYLKTMATRATKERERLEQEIQLCEVQEEDTKVVELKALKGSVGVKSAKHTVFVDTEMAQAEFDPQIWFRTDEAGLNNAYNRPLRVGNEGQADVPPKQLSQADRDAKTAKEAWKEQRNAQRKRESDQEKRRARLEAVKTRERELLAAEQEMAQQRDRMNNNVGGQNKNGVKFKVRERKR